jgi:hypothetical protein
MFGARVGIRVDDATALPALLGRLPAGHRVSRRPLVDTLFSFVRGGPLPGSHVRRFHILWSEQRQEARTLDEDVALDAFESTLARRLFAITRGYDFVHAGCVGWRGRAIVIPGRSMAGKSTLVDALVRAGATYYSDEYAVFDRRGRVHAFLRPIRLRRSDGSFRQIEVEEGGIDAARRPLPLGLIVQTRYDAGAQWRPRALSPGEKLLALMPHAARANRAPAAVMRVLARAAEHAGGIETGRGDAAEAADWILHRQQEAAAPAGAVSKDGR